MIERDEKHIYRVDGKVVPGVTEILADNKLIDLFGIPVPALEKARALGTEVHSVSEHFDKGSLKVETIDPAIVPYFTAYLKFLKENKVEILEIENFVYSKTWKYCGQIDRVVQIGKKKGIIDLKSTTGMPAFVTIQTALYGVAYEEYTGNKIDFRWAVQLKPDGTYKLFPHEEKTDKYIGLAAVQLFNWRRKHKVAEGEYNYEREIFG